MNDLLYVITGFVSYILLRPFGLFNFYSESDRQITLIILSLINSGVTKFLTHIFKLNNIWYPLLISVLITSLYAVVFIFFQKFSEWLSDKLNINLFDNRSTTESILAANYRNKEMFLISFDFEGNFISSGYVKNVDDKGNQQIALYGKNEEIYSVSDAQQMYSENPENSIILDYKNKIKNYVIIC